MEIGINFKYKTAEKNVLDGTFLKIFMTSFQIPTSIKIDKITLSVEIYLYIDVHNALLVNVKSSLTYVSKIEVTVRF